MQPQGVASWWQPGHPGWAIYPVDSDHFMSTGALDSLSVQNDSVAAPPQPGSPGIALDHGMIRFNRFQALLQRCQAQTPHRSPTAFCWNTHICRRSTHVWISLHKPPPIDLLSQACPACSARRVPLQQRARHQRSLQRRRRRLRAGPAAGPRQSHAARPH